MSTKTEFKLEFTINNKNQFNVNDYFTWDSGTEPYGDSTWVGDGVFRWAGKKTEKFSYLNTTAKNILFPNNTAKPVAGYMGGNVARTGLSNTAYLRGYIGGTQIFEKSRGATSYAEGQADIPSNILSSMSKNTEIKWGGQASSTATEVISGRLFISLTFMRHTFVANKTGYGVQSVSVSRDTGYDGDSVTFTATLLSGATFDGWYDDNGTKVSSDVIYTCTPNADLTLYAKATVTATVYNCSAVAGENVTSATVNDDSFTAGDSAIFTATIANHCVFDGWYTALTGGTKVSGNNPYTHTVTDNTTLYARATKDTYSISAVASDHCSASVNRNTAQYGDSAIFTATLDTGYDFDGWYTASSGGTKVSGNNPYTHTVTGNTTLYARAVLHLFAINLDAGNTDTNHYGENQKDENNLNSGSKTLANMTIYAVAVKWDLMSAADINNFNNGNFSAISSTARADYQTAVIKRNSGSWIQTYSYWAPKLTINTPYGYTLGLYATSGNALHTSSSTTIYSEGVKYYWSTSNANNSVTGTGLTANTWNAGFENYTTKNFIAANDVGVTRIDNVTANGSYYYNSFAYHDNQLNATYGISSVSADATRSCTIDAVGIHATVQDSRFFFKEWRIGSKNGTAVGANSANYTVPANHHDYLTIGTSRPYTADMVMYAIADTNQTKWYPTAHADKGVTATASQDWIVANDDYAVTYTATLDSRYKWSGWYRDAEGTDLVSKDLTITYIPSSADHGVLYAKATSGIYFKRNGEYITAKAVYTKENGSWVEQTNYDSIFDPNGKYKIR